MSQIYVDASINDVLVINLKDSTTANLAITVGDILNLTKPPPSLPPHAGTIQELGYNDLSKRIGDLAVRLAKLEELWADLDRRFVKSMRTLRTAAHNAEGTSNEES